MNRQHTVRTVLLAAPIAFGALLPTAGMAFAVPPAPVNPGEIAHPGHIDPPKPPKPNPEIPHGPGDLGIEVPDPCGPAGCFPPGEDDDEPELNPDLPDGPGEVTGEQPCPTHGECGGGGDGGEDGGTDDSGTDDGSDSGSGDGSGDGAGDGAGDGGTGGLPVGGDIPLPTRIDTGAGGDGFELSWVLAGGAVLTATLGAAELARRTARRTR